MLTVAVKYNPVEQPTGTSALYGCLGEHYKGAGGKNPLVTDTRRYWWTPADLSITASAIRRLFPVKCKRIDAD
eukprot:4517695-Pyramimonas_sp.AAC.1